MVPPSASRRGSGDVPTICFYTHLVYGKHGQSWCGAPAVGRLRGDGSAPGGAGGRAAGAGCAGHRGGVAWRLLVVGAVLWLVVRFLAGLTLVKVPIVLALLLAALLQRPVLVLRRYLPRWLAALTVLVLALGVLAGVGYLVAWRVRGQSARLVDQASGILGDLRARVADLPGIGAGSSSLVDQATQWLQAHESTVLTGALTAGTVALEVVTGLVLTLFLTLFLLLDGDRIWAWCVRLLPRRVRPAANGAGHRAWRVLSGWIGGTALIALIHAVVIGGGARGGRGWVGPGASARAGPPAGPSRRGPAARCPSLPCTSFSRRCSSRTTGE